MLSMNKRISHTIVTSDSSIRDAIKVINKGCVRGAFICEKDRELLGIVMDSDIRRALLHDFDMQASVKTIMNTSPFTIGNDVHPAERIQLLIKSNKMLVPIVDERKRVVDFIFLPDILDEVIVKRSMHKPKDEGIFPPGRILVIGGAGYIGSFLIDILLEEGYKVSVLDLLLYGKESITPFSGNPAFEFIRGDCRDREILTTVMDGIDAVIHLGEIVGDPACNINETFTIDINYSATHRIVDQCLKSKIRRFIFTSSCSVYGSNVNEVNEESDLNPVSLYARCKVESEKAILSYDYDHFCPTVLRLATVHGISYRQRFDLVVNLLTIKALVDKKIEIFGGDQWRPFISVKDVCKGILTVLQAPCKTVKNQIFNLGDSIENYRLIDISTMILNLLPEVHSEILEEQTDKRNYRVSFNKIKKVFGFRAESKVIASVKEIISAYHKDNLFSDYNDIRFHNYLSLK